MISISQHILYLITRHDCVILPGWGAFIAHHVPAHIDEKYIFMPPSRQVHFNSALTHNDGILISSIVRKEGIGYDSAVALVASEVESLRQRLQTAGEVRIHRIGTFRSNADGSILFDPATENIASAMFMGLQPVKIFDALPQNKAAEDSPATLEVDTRLHRFGHRLLRVAASVAVIATVALTLTTPIVNQLSDHTDQASMGADLSSQRKQSEFNFNQTYPFGMELSIAMPDPLTSVEIVDTVKNPLTTAPTMQQTDKGRYLLIVASLETRNKALNYIKKRSDQNLSIIERDGRYRIYCATAETLGQIEQIRSEYLKKYPDAWVFRR